MGNINIEHSRQTPNGKDQDKNHTESVPHQVSSSYLGYPDVTPGFPDVAEIEFHQDSQAQPKDLPPHSGGGRLFNTAGKIEAPEPTSEEKRPRLDTLSEGEALHLHNTNENAELLE